MKQIPGFYYDPEKRKYFRITADSRSVTQTSAAQYSRTAVQRRIESIKKEKQAKRDQDRRLKHTVSRSVLLRDPTYLSGLARESGDVSEICTSQLWSRNYSVSSVLHPSGVRISGLQRPYSRITAIAHDDGSGTSFVANFDGQVMMKCDDDDRKLLGTLKPCSNLAADPVICLTTSGASSPLLIRATHSGRLCLDRIDDLLNYQSSAAGWYLSHVLGDILFDCMANPSPSSSHCLIALAGSQPSFLTLSPSNLQHESADSIRIRNDMGDINALHSSSETLSVAWQTSQVLSWGCRDGGIDMTDIRAPSRSLRLIHSSAVRRLRHLGHTGHFVLAAGLQDKMALYDLRWCPPPKARKVSPPYLTYPSYRTKSRVDAGFDVAPSLDLIATARDGGGLSLIDIWTGIENKHRLQTAHNRDHVSCIKFTANEQSNEGIGRCLVGCGNDVESWVFGKQPS